MPQRILALECDAHELKAAVIETTFRDYRVVGFYREPVAGGAGGPAEQLRSFVQRHQLESTTTLSSLPGELVTLRTFFLPFRDRKRLEQTVPFELETQVPFGLDEIVVDYHVLHSDRAGSHLLAALVPRRDLEAHLQILSQAGLDPKVVDLASLAELNVLKLLGNDLPGSFVFIGGTGRRTTVALFRDRRLIGLRTVIPPAAPPPADTAETAAGNGQPAGEPEREATFFSEIRWTLLALNGTALEAGLPCVVAGEGVQYDRLAQQVEAGMALAVRRLDQAPLRTIPAALRAELPGFVSPLGLALREAVPDGALGLNFRRGEFAYHRGQEEIRQALWRTASLGVVVLALLFTNMYMGYEQLVRRLDLVQAQVRNVFTQTLPGRRITDEKMQLQAEIDAEQARLKAFGGLIPMGGATAVDVMRTISAAIPDNLKLDIDEYIMDTEGVRAKAKAESFEAVDAIKQEVLNTKYFGDVQVKDVRAAPDGKGVDFRLVFLLNKEGAGATAKR